MAKKKYTPPRAVSRRWMDSKMSSAMWRDVLEMSNGFAFIFETAFVDAWPARRGVDS